MLDASASGTTYHRHGIVMASRPSVNGLDLLGLSCSCFELLVPNSSQHNFQPETKVVVIGKPSLKKILQLAVCKTERSVCDLTSLDEVAQKAD
jgi:hypothetical protein